MLRDGRFHIEWIVDRELFGKKSDSFAVDSNLAAAMLYARDYEIVDEHDDGRFVEILLPVGERDIWCAINIHAVNWIMVTPELEERRTSWSTSPNRFNELHELAGYVSRQRGQELLAQFNAIGNVWESSRIVKGFSYAALDTVKTWR